MVFYLLLSGRPPFAPARRRSGEGEAEAEEAAAEAAAAEVFDPVKRARNRVFGRILKGVYRLPSAVRHDEPARRLLAGLLELDPGTHAAHAA